jgi:hypothetical protein
MTNVRLRSPATFLPLLLSAFEKKNSSKSYLLKRMPEIRLQ